MVYKQREWTEEDILALPSEDSKYDRKAGLIVKSDGWKEKLAKEICAFANSAGGYIVLGMFDEKDVQLNGGAIFDGIDPVRNKKPFIEWLDAQISRMLIPRLQHYRTLPVRPSSTDSKIPVGKSLFVIEIDESEIAPHQTDDDRRAYYYREGTKSVAAHHFYLEGLRSVRKMASTELIRAWLDTFLLDLESAMRKIAQFYQYRDFFPTIKDSTFGSGFRVIIQPERTILIHSLTHANARQFLRRFPRFDEKFRDYNKLQDELNSHVDQLKELIAHYAPLDNFIFGEFLQQDRFLELLNGVGLRLDVDKIENRLRRFFEMNGFSPKTNKSEILDMIASVITYELLTRKSITENISGVSHNSQSMMFIRTWGMIATEVHKTLNQNAKISEAYESCEAHLMALTEFCNDLSNDLDNEIELLTARSGVPLSTQKEQFNIIPRY